MHLRKYFLFLTEDPDADLLPDLRKTAGKLAVGLRGAGYVHDHHHVEEAVHDRLGNVQDIDLIVGEIGADAGDDADSIFSGDCDDCSFHG